MATKSRFAQTATQQATEQIRKAPKGSKVKVNLTQDPPTVEVVDEVVEPATPFERLHQKVHGAYAEFMAESGAPGPKQRIAAWVLGFITACGLGYLGGWVSTLMMAVTLVATGSMFLGVMVYLLGFVLTLIGSTLAGTWVSEAVHRIKLDKLRDRVAGLFNRNNVEVSHA